MTAADQPAADRIQIVDALRGFALLGVLVVNISLFADTFNPLIGVENPAFQSWLDEAARYLVALFFESKFYLLFSFLFGYSFTLMIDSAERGGAPFTRRFLRRLLGLAVIGAAHAVLLWQGDILLTYALLGLILMTLRRLVPRTALRAAAALIVLTAALMALIGVEAMVNPDDYRANERYAAAEARAANAAYRGSPGEVIEQRVGELPGVAAVLLLFQAPTALAMFVVGLAAGKHRVFANIGEYRAQLRRIPRIGLPLGLAGAIVYAYTAIEHGDNGYALFGLAIDILAAPLLTATYVALLVLAMLAPRGRVLTAVLAPAGRMALTNYILQSLFCCLIFTGYGLGLIGKASPPVVLVIAAAIFVAQLRLSAWWMSRHRYGPLEWWLRALTNWAWPQRSRAAATADWAGVCRDVR